MFALFQTPSHSPAIRRIRVRDNTIYLTRNAAPVVQVVDLTSGRRDVVPIPERYAGAQAIGVDAKGWLYLGAAEGSTDKTAVIDPSGHLVAELGVATTHITAGPGAAVAVPGKDDTCGTYLGGELVHSYPVGGIHATTCLTTTATTATTAVGWSAAGGGFSVSKNASVLAVDTSAVPTSVVGPTGQTVATAISTGPRARCASPETQPCGR